MKKRRNKYKVFQDKCENKYDKFRASLEREIKPTIKTMALSVGCDMTSTQHSCYITNDKYDEREMNAFTKKVNIKFDPFLDMLYFLSDELKCAFYFEIEKGKFRWL